MRNTRLSRAFLPIAVLVVTVFGDRPAVATKMDQRPRPTYLFADAKRFLAQDTSDSVAIYTLGDPVPVHSFGASGRVQQFAVTADERYLLIACHPAYLSLWEIASGKRVWERTPHQTGLSLVWDASFSRDGTRLVVCDYSDQALVLDASSGDLVAAVRFPPMQATITSAALAPDGRTGVFIANTALYTFDATTGAKADTGLTGAWPVRYSTDGKYVACRSNNSGEDEQLRVVAMDGSLKNADVGPPCAITHIRPAPDGTFLVTGQRDRWKTVFGARIQPQGAKWVEAWHRPVDSSLGASAVPNQRTDFDPARMLGVSTTYRLETTVTNLETGAALQHLDNSRGWTNGLDNGIPTWWYPCLVVGGLLVALVAWGLFGRGRRRKRR